MEFPSKKGSDLSGRSYMVTNATDQGRGAGAEEREGVASLLGGLTLLYPSHRVQVSKCDHFAGVIVNAIFTCLRCVLLVVKLPMPLDAQGGSGIVLGAFRAPSHTTLRVSRSRALSALTFCAPPPVS